MAAIKETGSVVGIYAIDGMAGVGKSAFAVHAAHVLAPRFPDGQIFLQLHAHTDTSPLTRLMRWPACYSPLGSPPSRSRQR
jgi:hypothetical protein